MAGRKDRKRRNESALKSQKTALIDSHSHHVPEMTETEAINVRARIFAGVVSSLGLPEFDTSIPSSVLRGPGAKGPRKFKTACTMAVGRALARGEFSVSEIDFQSGTSAPAR
jgi:hypothetical protein